MEEGEIFPDIWITNDTNDDILEKYAQVFGIEPAMLMYYNDALSSAAQVLAPLCVLLEIVLANHEPTDEVEGILSASACNKTDDHTQIPTNNPTTMMPPKTKPVLEDPPENNDDHAQESSTAILLERLINHTTKHDDTLALLTELLGKQQKQSLSKDTYTPWGIPLPKASDIPRFLGPLGDADKVLTHLHCLQQVLHLHGLLMQLDDADMEER
ncbi:hypothetical protein D1P53_004373 [Cryptococcus gattii VGV]|nr:hypothetical protein D1P53_004373 [Cryptococcus gattii VGV]